MNESARSMIYKLHYKATTKHPEFANSPEQGVCVIAEEFGELAREILKKGDGWETRSFIEAGHVAVTAIRMMEMMADELNGTNCEECEAVQTLLENRYAKCKKHGMMEKRGE